MNDERDLRRLREYIGKRQYCIERREIQVGSRQ